VASIANTLTIEISVETLGINAGFSDLAFAVETLETSRPYCLTPKPPIPLHLAMPDAPLLGVDETLPVWAFAVVQPDGHVGEAAILGRLPARAREALRQALKQSRFQPATCDGIPVARSSLLRLRFGPGTQADHFEGIFPPCTCCGKK
jgi:hypothetical protein